MIKFSSSPACNSATFIHSCQFDGFSNESVSIFNILIFNSAKTAFGWGVNYLSSASYCLYLLLLAVSTLNAIMGMVVCVLYWQFNYRIVINNTGQCNYYFRKWALSIFLDLFVIETLKHQNVSVNATWLRAGQCRRSYTVGPMYKYILSRKNEWCYFYVLPVMFFY